MQFVYKNQKGDEKEFSLVNWKEVGHYIEGVCTRAGAFRTFRKDRVIEYLGNCADQLRDPFPPPPPAVRVRRTTTTTVYDGRLQILFTGFPSEQRAELELQAADVGMQVCKSVTQRLHFLCTGPNAGPRKIQKSRELGTYIVDLSQFQKLVETGELPDDEVTPLNS